MVKICAFPARILNPTPAGIILPIIYSSIEEYSAAIVNGLVYSWCFLCTKE
jgi:hypothetical protein